MTNRTGYVLIATCGALVLASVFSPLYKVIDLSTEDPDYTFAGANAGDGTGQTVELCDFNGDGRNDVVVGSPGFTYMGRSACGVIYVILGADTLPATVDLSEDRDDVLIIFGPDEMFAARIGNHITCGDFNGDGRDDVAVGVPTASHAGGSRAGTVYIVFGSDTPVDSTDLETPPANVTTILGPAPFEKLGSSLSSGNVDNDMYDDLLAGAPNASPPSGFSAGKAYVVFGSSSPPAVIDLASATGITEIHGERANDVFGTACHLVDTNDDSFDDIVVGAPQAELSLGVTYLFAGGTSLEDSTLETQGATGGFVRIIGRDANGLLGSGLSGGNVTGSEHRDLLIGAPDASPLSRNRAGSVYVIAGMSVWPDTIDLAGAPTGVSRIDGPQAGTTIGLVLGVGDMNVDGLRDIVIGIPEATPRPQLPEAGKVYIVFGRSVFAPELDLNADQTGITQVWGDASQTRYGSSVTIGLMNGDLFEDLLMGGATALVDGDVDVGKAAVILGSTVITPTRLVSYAGFADERTAQITWELIDDLNPSLFTLRRSVHSAAVGTQMDLIAEKSGRARYRFTDPTVQPGETYTYTVGVQNPDLETLFRTTVTIPNFGTARLGSGYPNPFVSETTLPYQLDKEGEVDIRVFNVRGALVAVLTSGFRAAGPGQVVWNGRDTAGNRVPAGVYFVRMTVENRTFEQKSLLVR
ncbi:MAG: T9SS type A sorting domain-containing protein [bacterium]|nr:T9SS type A sorting domain-containing protein [bacterium]